MALNIKMLLYFFFHLTSKTYIEKIKIGYINLMKFPYIYKYSKEGKKKDVILNKDINTNKNYNNT